VAPIPVVPPGRERSTHNLHHRPHLRFLDPRSPALAAHPCLAPRALPAPPTLRPPTTLRSPHPHTHPHSHSRPQKRLPSSPPWREAQQPPPRPPLPAPTEGPSVGARGRSEAVGARRPALRGHGPAGQRRRSSTRFTTKSTPSSSASSPPAGSAPGYTPCLQDFATAVFCDQVLHSVYGMSILGKTVLYLSPGCTCRWRRRLGRRSPVLLAAAPCAFLPCTGTRETRAGRWRHATFTSPPRGLGAPLRGLRHGGWCPPHPPLVLPGGGAGCGCRHRTAPAHHLWPY